MAVRFSLSWKPRPLWRGVRVSSPIVIPTDFEVACATEEEWRDPEDVSSAMLLQGISAQKPVLSHSPG